MERFDTSDLCDSSLNVPKKVRTSFVAGETLQYTEGATDPIFALEREIDMGARFSAVGTTLTWIASASKWKFDR